MEATQPGVLCCGCISRWTGQGKGYAVGNEIWEWEEHVSIRPSEPSSTRTCLLPGSEMECPWRVLMEGVSCFHFHSKRASGLLHCEQSIKGARVEAEKPFRSLNHTVEKCWCLGPDASWGHDEKSHSEYTLKAGLVRGTDGLVEACERGKGLSFKDVTHTDHERHTVQIQHGAYGRWSYKQRISRTTQSSLEPYSTTWGKPLCFVSARVPADRFHLSQ